MRSGITEVILNTWLRLQAFKKGQKTVLIWSFSLDFEVILWANFMVVLVVSFLAMSHTNEEVSHYCGHPEHLAEVEIL